MCSKYGSNSENAPDSPSVLNSSTEASSEPIEKSAVLLPKNVFDCSISFHGSLIDALEKKSPESEPSEVNLTPLIVNSTQKSCDNKIDQYLKDEASTTEDCSNLRQFADISLSLGSV